jgi:uncharacterized membrane protein YqjE
MTGWFGRTPGPAETSGDSAGSPFGVAARHFLAHFQARALLLAVETREAFRELSGRSLHAAAGGLLLLIGYALLLACAVPLLADAFRTRWEFVGLGLAGLHLAAGGFVLRRAGRPLPSPLFALTLDELEKDRQWLSRTPPDSPKKRS